MRGLSPDAGSDQRGNSAEHSRQLDREAAASVRATGVTVVKTETIPFMPKRVSRVRAGHRGLRPGRRRDRPCPVVAPRRRCGPVRVPAEDRRLRLPKVVQAMRLTSGERIDIALIPPPANRLAHAVARFEASFVCRAVPGGTEVNRSLEFRFAPSWRGRGRTSRLTPAAHAELEIGACPTPAHGGPPDAGEE